MPTHFHPIKRDMDYLLPPSLQDWLPDNHLARFVVDIVDQLDSGVIEKQYGNRGKAAYHPSLLVSMLFYGYATGVFSSRKLEQASYDSVAFRYITADTHPDHDTIAHFRRRFLTDLDALFMQILRIAQSMNLLSLGKISLDGTKVKANASKHKALSWDYANKLEEQLKEEVEYLFQQAEAADNSESDDLDIPQELLRREDRLAAIQVAKQAIERRAKERFESEQKDYQEKQDKRDAYTQATGKKSPGRKPKAPTAGPKGDDQVNLTDDESRIMKTSKGFEQTYNAQAAVDTDSYLIVENHVTNHCNDKREVEPALKRLSEVEQHLGETIDAFLADTGYFSEANVNDCVSNKKTPYISTHREKHNSFLSDRNQPLNVCEPDADAVTQMKHRLQTKEGKAIYALRKSTVETVFGIIKQIMGFREFHLRGLDNVAGEWNLVSMAWNIKRMHRLTMTI